MIDLKKTKEQIKKENKPMELGYSNQEQYPYGTRLRFNKPEIDKLSVLKKSEAGEMVKISAIGKIIEVSTSANVERGRDHQSVEIQIMKIEIAGADKDMPSDEKDAFEEKE